MPFARYLFIFFSMTADYKSLAEPGKTLPLSQSKQWGAGGGESASIVCLLTDEGDTAIHFYP